MKVREFLFKCDKEVNIQIQEGAAFVNRGLADDLLKMDLTGSEIEKARLEKEIQEIGSQVYNAHYTLGKHVADIIIRVQ